MFNKFYKNLKTNDFNTQCSKVNGFSLIEVLMATTILGVIAAGMSTLLVNQMGISIYLDDKASKRDLKMELDRLLSTEASCLATLDAITIPQVGVDKDLGQVIIKDQLGNVAFSQNIYDRLSMIGATLRNLDIANTDSSGMTELTINLERQRDGGGPKSLEGLRFKLNTNVDSTTRAITKCSSIGASKDGSGCLRPVSVHSLITYNSSAPINVPSNIAAAEIIIHHYDRSGGSEGDSCSVSPRVVYLKFNGELDARLVSGRSFTVQTIGGFNASRAIFYNGLRIADHRTCQPNQDGTSISHPVYVTRSSLDTCRIATDPLPPHGGYGSSPGASLTLYRYDSDL